MKTLFSHVDILINDPKNSVIQNGYLGVDDDKICYIGREKPADPYDFTKTLDNCLIVPGFYNLHTHTPMSILRGLGSHLPLDQWLEQVIFPIEAVMEQPDYSVGSRLAMMEMLAGGVVGFSDMYHHPEYYVGDVLRSGMKANLCEPIMFINGDMLKKHAEKIAHSVGFFQTYHGESNGRLRIDFAIHAEYTSTEETVRGYGQKCLEHGARMHLHMSETRKEHDACKARYGVTPAAWFDRLGVFENPTNAAHCVMVEENDMKIMHEKGVTAVHNPSSNLKLGSGIMPIRSMMDHGVRVTIGTDSSASNNNQNLLEEMHLTALIHCGVQRDPTVLSPVEVIRFATRDGAAAQGRENCGSLAVGNQADFAVIDLDKPHLQPILDYPSLITYSAQASDVAMTVVDGKILYDHGEFLTIDADRVRHDLKACLKRRF